MRSSQEHLFHFNLTFHSHLLLPATEAVGKNYGQQMNQVHSVPLIQVHCITAAGGSDVLCIE